MLEYLSSANKCICERDMQKHLSAYGRILHLEKIRLCGVVYGKTILCSKGAGSSGGSSKGGGSQEAFRFRKGTDH